MLEETRPLRCEVCGDTRGVTARSGTCAPCQGWLEKNAKKWQAGVSHGPTRYCRHCGNQLNDTRYFNCERCVNLPAENHGFEMMGWEGSASPMPKKTCAQCRILQPVTNFRRIGQPISPTCRTCQLGGVAR